MILMGNQQITELKYFCGKLIMFLGVPGRKCETPENDTQRRCSCGALMTATFANEPFIRSDNECCLDKAI